MGVSVQWDNDEQSAVRYIVDGRWTWDEFYDALAAARYLIQESNQPRIHAIIDISDGSLFPKNALIHLRRLSSDTPSRMKSGSTVIVSTNLFVKSLMDVMSHLNPNSLEHFYLVRTLNEARSILQPVTASVG